MASLFATALVSWLALAPSPDLAQDVDWGESSEGDEDHADQLLSGIRLPGLIDTRGLDVGLQADGMYGLRGPVSVDAGLDLLGEVEHPLDSEIAEVTLSIGLFEASQARHAADRLTRPPLQLTQDELDEHLPSPIVSIEQLLIAEQIDTGAVAHVELSHPLGEIEVNAEELPEYLLVVRHYRLVAPTIRDIETILERGSTADHAALAQWAEQFRDIAVPLDEQERSRIVAKVRERFRRLRAPPALGDYQRLRSMVALIRTMATPSDVEALLKLERPMKILHTSAMLSYDLALSDESSLDLPVHGMHLLPTRSEFMASSESAYRSLRPMALEKLLRISFDPVDFRNAPASLPRHRLRRQAVAMLQPLRPTNVTGVLAAADGRPEVQREVLRFYLEARHEPVAEPLVLWLSEHPDAMDDLGALAVRSLPSAILPAALQRYVDPRDPDHRQAMRTLLLQMPNDRVRTIVEALRSLGVPLDLEAATATPGGLEAALDEFEAYEREMASERAAELVATLQELEHDPGSLRSALRDAGRLAQLAPAEVEANADVLLEIHAAAAMEFDEETPLERMRALRQLVQLPWGNRSEDARRVHAVTEARIAISRGESTEALDKLLEFDESLTHAEVRELYAQTLEKIFDAQLERSQYEAAEHTLELAAEHVPEEIDVESLRREVSWRRYRAGYFLGAAFALAFLSGLMWLLVRGSARAIGRWRDARKEMVRLERRQADAESSANEAASFDDDGSTVVLTEGSANADSTNDPPSAEPDAPPDEASETPSATEAPEPSDDAETPQPSDDVPEDLEGSDDPLDDPLGDPFEWDSPFEDDIFSDIPRASGES